MSPVQLLFQNPHQRIAGKERKSKLLHQDSELYHLLKRVQADMRDKLGLEWEDRMDLHVELLKRGEDRDDVELQHRRANFLQGRLFDLSRPNALYWCCGTAFAVNVENALVPADDDNDSDTVGLPPDTHITVAFLGRTKNLQRDDALLEKLRQLTLQLQHD